MLLKSGKVEEWKSGKVLFHRFYSVCGAVACAAFLSGWLLAIVSHF